MDGFLFHYGTLTVIGFLHFHGTLSLVGFLRPPGTLAIPGFLHAFGTLASSGFLTRTGALPCGVFHVHFLQLTNDLFLVFLQPIRDYIQFHIGLDREEFRLGTGKLFSNFPF